MNGAAFKAYVDLCPINVLCDWATDIKQRQEKVRWLQ